MIYYLRVSELSPAIDTAAGTGKYFHKIVVAPLPFQFLNKILNVAETVGDGKFQQGLSVFF